jgi:hypothetical protein
MDGLGHRLVMLIDPFLRGLVVIWGDKQCRVRPQFLGRPGQFDGFSSVVATRAGDHGHTPRRLLHGDADDPLVLLMGERGGLAGCAGGYHGVHAGLDLAFHVRPEGFLVDLAVPEGRH